VSEETAARLGLAIGLDVGSEEVEEARDDDERGRARERALRLLAVRARSRSELVDRLRRLGFDAETVAITVERLAGAGLVDDRAFAEAWVDERTRLRPMGRLRLSSELRAKGVRPEVIAEVLDEALDEATELALARRAAGKRTRTVGKSERGAPRASDRAKLRSRLQSFLTRRGFSYDVVSRVVRELEGDADD